MSCKSCKIEGCNEGFKPTLNGDGTKCECECHSRQSDCQKLVEELEKLKFGGIFTKVLSRPSDREKYLEANDKLDQAIQVIKNYYGEDN